jgi:hypothetical protein
MRFLQNKRQLNGEDEGVIHLPGLGAHDHQTFCGHCWHFEEHGGVTLYEFTDDPATCPGCQKAAAEASKLLSAIKRRRLWVP